MYMGIKLYTTIKHAPIIIVIIIIIIIQRKALCTSRLYEFYWELRYISNLCLRYIED